MKRKSREYLITHAAWSKKPTVSSELPFRGVREGDEVPLQKTGAVYIEPERQDEERRVPDRFGE